MDLSSHAAPAKGGVPLARHLTALPHESDPRLSSCTTHSVALNKSSQNSGTGRGKMLAESTAAQQQASVFSCRLLSNPITILSIGTKFEDWNCHIHFSCSQPLIYCTVHLYLLACSPLQLWCSRGISLLTTVWMEISSGNWGFRNLTYCVYFNRGWWVTKSMDQIAWVFSNQWAKKNHFKIRIY